nr:Q-dependent dehydrogenase [Pandoravirus belohorizontensis]
MIALDAATGAILWEYTTGAATLNGPAVVDGTVYWGTGYGYMSTPGKAFYAFRPTSPVSHCWSLLSSLPPLFSLSFFLSFARVVARSWAAHCRRRSLSTLPFT